MIRLLLLAAVVGLAVYHVHRWRRERHEDTLARIRSAFFVLRPRPSATERQPPLRTVTLGEGRLRFRVPSAWEEEPAAGAFCARASTSRRLRVELRTLERGGTSADALAETLRESPAGRKGTVEVLPGQRVLRKHVESGRAGEDDAVTYCWDLAVPSAPDRARLVEFRFSVPLEAVDAITEDDLLLLEREIREAGFSAPA